MRKHLRSQRLLPIIPTWWFLVTAVSCSLSGPIREDRSASNYYFPALGPGWTLAPSAQEGAEMLYEHGSGATLSVSSVCDRYEDATLDSLASSALSPLIEQKELHRSTFMLQGREALEVLVQGKVDGVKVEVDLVELRKDNCLFDFSIQQASKILPKLRTDFFEAVNKFRYPR